MAFPCVVADVATLLPQRSFGASTKPTSTQVSGYISSVAAELRAILRKHSISEAALDTNAVALLNYINAKGAAYRAEVAAYGQTEALPDRVKDLGTEYQDWLDKLEDNPGYLSTTDIPSNVVRSRWTTITPGDDGDDTEGENAEPEFKRDDKW